METIVIKQLLLNKILSAFPEDMVNEIKDFAFIDMVSYQSKNKKDIVNSQIEHAEMRSCDIEPAELEPYLGDVWDDPDNDPWANDEINNYEDEHEIAFEPDFDGQWAFSTYGDDNVQFQSLFCITCGNYVDGWMQNQDLLIDIGLIDIPYPERILCKCVNHVM